MNKTQLLTFLTLLITNICFAGEYKLINGSDIGICTDYLSSLNLNPIKMVCDRKVSNTKYNIKEVSFNEVDVWENRKLEKQIYSFLHYGKPFSKKVDTINHYNWIKEWLKYNQIKMLSLAVDINNDGKVNKIIKYVSGGCETKHFGTPLIVLYDSGQTIDIKNTMSLSRNNFKTETSTGRWLYNLYDIFLYKDESYFDRWNYEKNKLNVYQLKEGKVTNLCEIEYEY